MNADPHPRTLATLVAECGSDSERAEYAALTEAFAAIAVAVGAGQQAGYPDAVLRLVRARLAEREKFIGELRSLREERKKLRDDLACAALQTAAADSPQDKATMAYAIADAMLAVRRSTG
jgi:hypothetical protein